MKVLITGACGYIGSSLIRQLEKVLPGAHIVCYDNLSRNVYSFFLGPKLKNVNLEFVPGDLLDTRLLKELINDEVDYIIHLAGMVTTPFAETNFHLYDQVNHWGTSSLAMAAEGSSVKKIVFLSSTSVYGNIQNPVNESSIPNPTTSYSLSKFRAEKQLARLSNQIDTTIIRSANVFGYNESMRVDAFVNKFAFEAKFLSRVTVRGDSSQKRPIVHVEYLAELLAKVLLYDQSPEVLNVVDEHVTAEEVLETIRDFIPEVEVIYSDQLLPQTSLLVDSQFDTIKQIGTPKRSLKQSLEEIFEHFL